MAAGMIFFVRMPFMNDLRMLLFMSLSRNIMNYSWRVAMKLYTSYPFAVVISEDFSSIKCALVHQCLLYGVSSTDGTPTPFERVPTIKSFSSPCSLSRVRGRL